MKELIKKIKAARFIWICGNGGSAATADHFATDLIKKGYRAISLSSNAALITMIANDYDYEHIFTKQLSVVANREDLVICISCSGSSPNIVNVQKVCFNNLECDYYTFPTFNEDFDDYSVLENEHLRIVHEVKDAL